MSTRTKKTSDSSEKLSRFPMVITDRTAVISVLGRPYSISRDAADFDAIRAAAQDPETTPAQMIALLSPKKAVEFALSKDGKVKVTKDGKFTVDGREVHNLIAKRLVELLREGFDVSPWLRFAESCIANPFQVDNILDELLPWAEKIKAPMTPRGGLLLFKKVKEDYFDSHTGCTHQNLIGATIEMESSKAQLDRSECGRGIHCSGWGYVHSFSGERIILIEVMPEDFIHVSIAHNKARVLKYVVVDEIERGPNGQFPTEQPIEYAPLVVIESIHEKKAVRKNRRAEAAAKKAPAKKAAPVQKAAPKSTPKPAAKAPAKKAAAPARRPAPKVTKAPAKKVAVAPQKASSAGKVSQITVVESAHAGRITKTRAKALLKEHGTKAAIARYYGISQGTVSAWYKTLGV